MYLSPRNSQVRTLFVQRTRLLSRPFHASVHVYANGAPPSEVIILVPLGKIFIEWRLMLKLADLEVSFSQMIPPTATSVQWYRSRAAFAVPDSPTRNPSSNITRILASRPCAWDKVTQLGIRLG